jgi:hypothetical protein
MRRFVAALGLIATVVLCTAALTVGHSRPAHAQHSGHHDFDITVLSSRPDTVTAGDALVRVEVAADVPMSQVTIELNHEDVTGAFRRDDAARTFTGLLDGLQLGENRLSVDAKGTRRTEHLTLVNHPKDGPIFSGPYQTPFICEAHVFQVPVLGTVLAAAVPPECSVPRRIDYFYRTTGGTYVAWPFPVELRETPLPEAQRAYPANMARTTITLGVQTPRDVPFIVRMETGSANRGIYHTWVVHDPYDAQPNFYTRSQGWNGRFLYWFGPSCTGGWYRQGTTAGLTMSGTVATPVRLIDFPLSRGYAVGMSSLTVGAINCNDVIAAEAMMTVKERMIETLGPPKFTMGAGLSAGAILAQMIADNYPGLLDGIVPGGSFPDVFSGVLHFLLDATLLRTYLDSTTGTWTPEQKRLVTGFANYATASGPSGAVEFAQAMKPREFCPPGLDPASLYDPVSNPTGIRCDIFSAYVNVFGADPETGFARRTFDNVGVQYGLGALNSGAISAAQFVELNERVGGFDDDGNLVPERTVGDFHAVRRAYRTGRINSGGGGLATTPVIDYRSYSDDQASGDHHLRKHSLSMRERIRRANGHAANHVMLVENLRNAAGAALLYAPIQSGLLVWAFEQMDRWLTNLSEDESDRPRIQKVIDAKPLDLKDGCHSRTRPATPLVVEGPEIVHDPTSPTTDCNLLYPVYPLPRGVAGEGIANDVLLCRLKPLDWSDYTVSAADLAFLQERLPAIFPNGVCDYTKRGVGQHPPRGTWISFGEGKGGSHHGHGSLHDHHHDDGAAD